MNLRYRKISTAFWNDAKVRRLTDDGKLALLFVLTHPNMTSLGMMRGNPAGLACELGWTPERFTKAFGEALREGLLEAFAEASLIALPNFMKHNKPESPNVVKSWAQLIPDLPECPLKDKHLQRVKAFAEGLGKAFREALPKAFAKALPNPEPELLPEPEPELLDSGRSIDADSVLRAREASHPTHISAVFTQETEEPDLVERIVAVTSEPDWRDWWTTVLERLDGAGVAGELDGWVRYAENCADPRQRELKDLGELQNPGGFLAKKATALCRRARVRWPAFPRQRATAQGGG